MGVIPDVRETVPKLSELLITPQASSTNSRVSPESKPAGNTPEKGEVAFLNLSMCGKYTLARFVAMWKTEKVPEEALGQHSSAAGAPKAGAALLLVKGEWNTVPWLQHWALLAILEIKPAGKTLCGSE